MFSHQDTTKIKNVYPFYIYFLYRKDVYHVVIEDMVFNFEDYAIQSYVPEIGF